jgi:hypothetical protein
VAATSAPIAASRRSRSRTLLLPASFHLYSLCVVVATILLDGLVEVHLAATLLTALLALANVAHLAGRGAPRTLRLGAVLFALTAIGFVGVPSVDGFHILLWLAGGLLAAGLMADRADTCMLLLKVAIAAFWIQVVVGTVQAIRGTSIGLGWLGERAQPFAERPPFSPTGTHYHSYPTATFGMVLAAISLVAGLRKELSRPWAIAGSTGAVYLAILSASRAAFLGAVAMAGVSALIAARGRMVDRRHLAILVVPFIFTVAATSVIVRSGLRQEVPATGTVTLDSMSTGRIGLVRQSVQMFKDHPLGVGPGNYMHVLLSRPDLKAMSTTGRYQPVHNVPLLIANEVGLQGFAVLVAMFATLVVRVRRTGLEGLLVFLAPLTFLNLDPAFWQQQGGPFHLGLWIGYLLWLANRRDVATNFD